MIIKKPPGCADAQHGGVGAGLALLVTVGAGAPVAVAPLEGLAVPLLGGRAGGAPGGLETVVLPMLALGLAVPVVSLLVVGHSPSFV